MTKSYFTGKVVEEKWIEGYYLEFVDDGGFTLAPRYAGMTASLGYWIGIPREYNRLAERNVFAEYDIPVTFKEGYKVEINNETVIIEGIVYGIDGSITYHTNKELERIVLKSAEDCILDEIKRLADKEKRKEEEATRISEEGIRQSAELELSFEPEGLGKVAKRRMWFW